MQALRERFQLISEQIRNRMSRGRLALVAETVNRFAMMRGPETAATLAYYALFSLFPLILFLVAVLGYLMKSSEAAYIQTIVFFGNVLPVSFTAIQDNLREVMKLRSSLGIIGIIGALWSASSFFTTLARSVNRAWPGVRIRNVMQSRLIGIFMVGSLFVLLLFSLMSSAFVNLVPQVLETLGIQNYQVLSPVWQVVLRIVPGLISFFMFVAMYRWVPNRMVCWRAVLIGALITALAWEGAKLMFGYFIGSGLLHYELLYGSLSTFMALMFWIYLSSLIALFGAFVVATLDMQMQSPPTTSAINPVEQKGKPTVVAQQDGG